MASSICPNCCHTANDEKICCKCGAEMIPIPPKNKSGSEMIPIQPMFCGPRPRGKLCFWMLGLGTIFASILLSLTYAFGIAIGICTGLLMVFFITSAIYDLIKWGGGKKRVFSNATLFLFCLWLVGGFIFVQLEKQNEINEKQREIYEEVLRKSYHRSSTLPIFARTFNKPWLFAPTTKKRMETRGRFVWNQTVAPTTQRKMDRMFAGVEDDYLEVLNSNALFELGMCYLAGKGVEQDNAEAVKCFREAAESGNPQAQIVLGVSYETGLGVEKDSLKAQIWYDKAADQINEDVAWDVLERLDTETGTHYITFKSVLEEDWKPMDLDRILNDQ